MFSFIPHPKQNEQLRYLSVVDFPTSVTSSNPAVVCFDGCDKVLHQFVLLPHSNKVVLLILVLGPSYADCVFYLCMGSLQLLPLPSTVPTLVCETHWKLYIYRKCKRERMVVSCFMWPCTELTTCLVCDPAFTL